MDIDIIHPSFEINQDLTGTQILKRIEQAGRTCYKSEELITEDSAKAFVAMVMKRGHLSVIEHEKVTMRVICDRGVSHEIVRHRIASYSQESTRYVNYNKKKMQFIDIRQFLVDAESVDIWLNHMVASKIAYTALIERGNRPEIARSVLPNSLKTEIVITMNLREWVHFFTLRCAPMCHPQMLEITTPMLVAMRTYIPVVFDNLKGAEK